MRDDIILACVVVVAASSVFSAFALAWLCAQVTNLRGVFAILDSAVADALAQLDEDDHAGEPGRRQRRRLKSDPKPEGGTP